MKKDIEIPVAKEVYVVLVKEWNKDFLSQDWNAYLVNNRSTPIEMVLVVSKGFDGDRKTATMRHGMAHINAKSFEKIEQVQEDVLHLTNEFFVTFYADNKLYERRFIFEKDSYLLKKMQPIPVMETEGVFASW